MKNFMKTILSAVQTWTKGKIKESTADWNENDSSTDSYVKNRTHWEEITDVILLTNYVTKGGTYPEDVNVGRYFEIGDVCTVICDGITYDNLVVEKWEDEYNGIGGMWGDYSVYPFGVCTGYNGISLYTAESHKITLIQKNATAVHTLDAKYLPEEYATVEEVDAVQSAAWTAQTTAEIAQTTAETAQTTADEKMDATNPVGTGSFSINRLTGTIIGPFSFASGKSTTASGNASHAEGQYTIANGCASHVEGLYNISDTTNIDRMTGLRTYAHIVGNGTADDARSNAHTLDWDGNAWFQGDVYTGSTSGTNKDEGSKKLATEEYVDEAVVSVSDSVDAVSALVGDTAVSTQISDAIAQVPQSDWNAADGEDGHVLNRTHFIGKEDVVLADNITLADGSNCSYVTCNAVKDCETVTVVYDGTTYVCPVTFVIDFTEYGDESYFYIGNFRDYAPEYPFYFFGYIGNDFSLFNATGGGEHVVSVISHVETVKKLDNKFVEAVLYSEAQELTDEQKAQARANISKYDWRDITIANTNYTIADYSKHSTGAEACAFDIDEALSCTGAVLTTYSSIATIAHMANMLFNNVLNGGSSTTLTALKNIVVEYENLITQGVIGDNPLLLCCRGSNDNINVAYSIGVTSATEYTHAIEIMESVNGFRGRIFYNSETTDYDAESFMFNYNDTTLTKQGYIADAKAVGDALALKADASHTHDDLYYTESEVDTLLASKSDAFHSHDSAYDALGAADTALASAKSYADSAVASVKNDLLNGAGEQYDTLKELGELINENTTALDALETVASGKADAVHNHTVANITDLTETVNSLIDAKLAALTNAEEVAF